MPLDADTVLALGRLRDPLGVLSVYVDARPEGDRAAVAAIETRNALSELQSHVGKEGPRERWIALRERLEELGPALERLTASGEPGRGRALFAGLTRDEVREVALQLPFANRVVLEETAYVRPLVAALAAGRPAGLVTISRSGVTAHDWRLGEVEEVVRFELDEDTESWRRMKGPAPPTPAIAQQSASQPDRFERRLEQHREGLLAALGPEVAALAVERGWRHLLVAGEERLAVPLVGTLLLDDEVEVTRTQLLLEGLSGQELASRLEPELEEARARGQLALVERVKAAAAAGGRGAAGLRDVLAALAEGRVERLLFDEGRTYAGTRAPDGRLFPAGLLPPDLGEEELEPEPRLAERMIERSLETGAEPIPVTATGAEALADCEGVAALLRW